MVPRTLTPADAPAYVELRREMLLDAPWAFLGTPENDMGCDPVAVAGALAEDENRILAIDGDDGALVAAAGVLRSRREKTRHRASIWGVYTTPRLRHRGLGASLVRAAIETARAWPGVAIVGLSVSARAAGALRLYQALGFEEWGVEPDALRVDGISYAEHHLALPLAPR